MLSRNFTSESTIQQASKAELGGNTPQPVSILWYTAGVPRRIAVFSWMLIFIQACSMVAAPAIEPIAENTPLPAATQQVQAPTSVTPSQVKIAQPSSTASAVTPSAVSPSTTPTVLRATRTPTPVSCLRAGGEVKVNELATELLPEPLVYRIYLPPCYEEDSEQSYPVLYLIHGQTFSDTQWQRLGVPEVADKLIAEGELPPFIVVMPKDERWMEPDRDTFGLAVVGALLPWVDEHYRTNPEREYRAIGGLSRGAAWAAYLGFLHPDLFGAIGIHSGFIFYGRVQEVNTWLEDIPQGMMPRIYMDIGDDDAPEITASATWLEQLLTNYGIPHEWHMFAGEHEEAYWSTHVEDYLRWYAQNWSQ